MPLANIPLTKDDLVNSQWSEAIADSPEKDCSNYWHRFYSKAQEVGALGDQKMQEVYTLLGAITSLMLKLDSKTDPFQPIAVFRTGRSAILDDIHDMHLETLGKWVPEVSDAELRARIADILWVRKRDYRMAQLAIEAYLESAKTTLEHPENWLDSAERVERALQLAASLGRKSDFFPRVVAHIESILDRYQGEDPLFLSARMMELLQKYQQGSPVKYIALAEKAALRAEGERAWNRARTYWRIKAEWDKQAEDTVNERASLLKSAETYVSEADEAVRRPGGGYIAAAAILQQGIEAFRRIPGTQERIRVLHRALLDYGQKSLGEMKSHSEQIDISQYVVNAREAVKGKSTDEALFTLAMICTSPSVSALREEVQELTEQYPLQHLFAAVMVNESGKVIGYKPSTLSDNPEEVEAALRVEMYSHAVMYQTLYAQAVIEPARSQINLEHVIRLRDVVPIVANNPFVPPGREEIFLRGLHAGLTGDFLVAAHLLIPQVENSIRYLLSNRGVITSSVDSQGIQEEYGLNTLLNLPEAKALFGDDILFDLQGLLIERYGSNLRNKLSHGLMDHGEFLSLQVSYLWWLILRLCCITLISATTEEKSAHGSREETGTSSD